MAAGRYFSIAQLSDNISETPEGFLICKDVPITRAGDFEYLTNETPVTGDGAADTVTITRTVETIHNPATIASFEGKPVTIGHPDDFVNPDNWSELAVGVIQNVRPGSGKDNDKLLADLLITDREAIHAVKEKKLREVSCGYEAVYVENAPGKGAQEGIMGNHVALVAAGRCGSECAIFDHAPMKPKQEILKMSLKEKIMSAFTRALDEAEVATSTSQTEQADTEGEAAVPPTAVDMLKEILTQLADVKTALAALVAVEQKEVEGEAEAATDADGKNAAATPVKKEEPAADMCKDEATIARAEILAPGIAKTADVKMKALDAAYATADGRDIIDSLLDGKSYADADKDTLFVGAAELMKIRRKNSLLSANRASLDSLPALKSGNKTPEQINAINAQFYANK